MVAAREVAAETPVTVVVDSPRHADMSRTLSRMDSLTMGVGFDKAQRKEHLRSAAIKFNMKVVCVCVCMRTCV